MNANDGTPSGQHGVIVAVALVLLCRAMWKFLRRVQATSDDEAIESPIGTNQTKDSTFVHDQNNNEQCFAIIRTSTTNTTASNRVPTVEQITPIQWQNFKSNAIAKGILSCFFIIIISNLQLYDRERERERERESAYPT